MAKRIPTAQAGKVAVMQRCFLLALLMMFGCCGVVVVAQDKPASLDDQLLDDLNSELLPAAKPAPVGDKKEAAPATSPSITESTDPANDNKLLDQLGQGEDIEFGPPKDPLARIGQQMRAAESLISKRDTSTRTQELQQQIVRDLDLLLQQTKQQCQGGQCQPSPKAGQPKPSPSNSPAKSKPSGDGEPGNKPAQDSTDRLGKPGENKSDDAAAMDQLVKEVWGHLPEKVRGQMQNVGVEQFLPKYERLIEEYYKRLAEEQSR